MRDGRQGGWPVIAKRSGRLAARLWWATLPYQGYFIHLEPGDRIPLHVYPLAWLNRLAARLPGSDPFEPMKPTDCDCDFCRGVLGAVFKP